MRPDASIVVIVGMPLIALVVFVALLFGARRAGANVWAMAAVLGAWSAIAAALSISGVLARFDARPPPIALFFVATLVIGLVLALSRTGAQLARLPLPLLVGFHAFRFPLELIMHQAASEGTMPVQMSYSGWNFDILTGISAAGFALFLRKRDVANWVLLAWNTLGSILLTTIVTIAFASTPIFHAFGTEPRHLNTWVAYFPFVYIALAVMGALVGHVVIYRRLFAPGMPAALGPRSNEAQTCELSDAPSRNFARRKSFRAIVIAPWRKTVPEVTRSAAGPRERSVLGGRRELSEVLEAAE